MATPRIIPWPDAAVVSTGTIEFWNPGQEVGESARSAASDVVSYGMQAIRGSVNIAPVETAQEAASIEGFLAGLRGRERIFELPIPLTGAGIGGVATVVDAIVSHAGVIQVEFAPTPQNMQVGSWLRVGDYARVVINREFDMVELEPTRPTLDGESVGDLETIRARLDEDPVLSIDPDFRGPWALRWREYVDTQDIESASPGVASPITDMSILVGQPITIGLSGHFIGDNLSFSVNVVGTSVSAVVTGGTNLQVTGLSVGSSVVSVRATNSAGGERLDSFTASVSAADLVVLPTVTQGFDQVGIVSGHSVTIRLDDHFSNGGSFAATVDNGSVASVSIS